ncbi:sulfotransferase [Pleurocapsa sp. PCC 7319]|uniref:sulfotransferase n=1 Tax=Pleurocapsa sp. PCC 7319 TaxID=118161 RepID=UPI000347820D|nr:sulfotransferase [Pleurocapsa sp. PCC 7319]
MSQWVGAIVLVVSFLVLIQLLGVTNKSKYVVRIALHSMKIIGSSRLSDEQKESKLRKNSLRLFSLFFILASGGAIAILIPLAILWLGDRLGYLSLSAVLATTVSPVFLIISTVITMIALYFSSNKKRDRSIAQTSSYSQLDRTLHQLAFNTYSAQITLADVEDNLFSKQITTYKNEKPVFITALPRAGTTLLLECCASSPEFAAHCYRDMPFVMIPCLWNRFSQIFQRNMVSTERAHGDGMEISPDSHEALEEVVWKTFWQRHYHRDRIIPWDYEENEEFQQFFDSHLRKIIFLRRQSISSSTRYVSKNNANIARIRMLNKLYPNSSIIVPFREPFHHASSLLQQHLNFLQIHQADPFAAEYMKAIGHYDFGQNLRPIDFDGWYDKRQSRDAKSLSFWLEYWIASYKYLLTKNPNSINFLDYDELCRNPRSGLKSLADILESSNPEALISSGSRIRHPRSREINTSDLSNTILEAGNLVYTELKNISLN